MTDRDTISYEEYQGLQELESLASESILVRLPGGQLLPKVRLTLTFRRVATSPQGSERITREDLIVRPEYAEVAAHQILRATSQAGRSL